jgi:hypothetical protein
VSYPPAFLLEEAKIHVADNMLKEFFGYRIISKGFWLHRSPDLTQIEFFVFVLLKTRVGKESKKRTRSEGEY